MPLATVPNTRQPTGLAVAEGRLYWLEPEGIRSAPIQGTLIVEEANFPDAGAPQVPLTISSSPRYVLAATVGGAAGSQLYSVPKGSLFSTVPPTLIFPGDATHLVLFAQADETTAYVTLVGGGGQVGFIGRVPVAGGPGAVHFARIGTQPLHLALAGGDVLFTAVTVPDGGADAIFRRPANGDGGTTTTIASEPIVGVLVVIGDQCYWSSRERGGMLRRRKTDASGDPEDVAAAPGVDTPLTTDGTHLFWLARRSDAAGNHLELWGCGVGARVCQPRRLAELPGDAELTGPLKTAVALGAEGDFVHWTEPGRNRIMRISSRLP